MTYGPAALACFFFGMSLLEGRTVDEAKIEVEEKFLPSYKVIRILYFKILIST